MSDRTKHKDRTVKPDSEMEQPEYWAPKIRESWQDSIGLIFETGRVLIEAKKHVRRGKWAELYKQSGFNKRVAQELIAVAKCPHFTEANRGSLPASWRTLYEISKLDADRFAEALKEGYIWPGMKRERFVDWRDGPDEEEASEPADEEACRPERLEQEEPAEEPSEPAKAPEKPREAAAERSDSGERRRRTMRPIRLIDLPGDAEDAGDDDAPIPLDLDIVRCVQKLHRDGDEDAAKEAAVEYMLSVDLEEATDAD